MSNEFELPNEEELRKLPLYSIVVYALRCALRVQPLLVVWKKPTTEYKEAVVKLKAAYNFLIYATDADPTTRAVDNVAKAAYAAAISAARNAMSADTAPTTRAAPTIKAARDAAQAAAAAANTVYSALNADNADNADNAYTIDFAAAKADNAAQAAAAAVAAVSTDGHLMDAADIVINKVNARADYERLLELNTKVTDASETGPLDDLWNGSPPDWYIEAKAEYDKTIAEWEREIAENEGEKAVLDPLQYKISFQVPSDMEDKVAIAKLKEFVLNLNGSHKANGGSGIKIDLLEIYESENVCVPSSPEGT